jgi:DtxR family Mn-dependent transcriptional regulator
MPSTNKTKESAAPDRPTPTIEDYLAVIYVLECDGGEVIAAQLAESLEVSAPTVTVTVKRMERDGWITVEQGKNLRLTERGRNAARSVIRRHMLTEWMLARMLNVPWSRVHAEADKIEHAISDQIETQMRSNLDEPQVCPHGNPLPGYEHVAEDWVALTEVPTGTKGILRRIHEIIEDNHELLEFLETNGIVPGARVEVTEILSFNQTLTVQVGDHPVALGLSIARYIFVELAA